MNDQNPMSGQPSLSDQTFKLKTASALNKMYFDIKDSDSDSDSDLIDKTSITGDKSLLEIIQLLRSNKKLITNKSLDINENGEDQLKENKVFPWMSKFTANCKEVITEPGITKLNDLLSTFIKNVEVDAKLCNTKPKRASKLALMMNCYMVFFHYIYLEIKKPLEHTSYLERMSEILSIFIDVELKASRRGREHPKKISERICSTLFLFLDKSMDHIIDAILKCKYFIKKNRDICIPVISRILQDNPGRLCEVTYVRYLLAFKIWKKLASKEQYVAINKDAVTKLRPPEDFAEKLKSGLLSNILPYVSKSEKDRLTHFFMQSPFNVKKKAQLFLKDSKKLQQTGDLGKADIFSENFKMASMFDIETEETDDDLLNQIWARLMEKDQGPLESLFDDAVEEKILVEEKPAKTKEKSKKISKDGQNNDLLIKPTMTKIKTYVPAINNSDKSKSVVTSNEGNSLVSSIKVEEAVKCSEKNSLVLSNSPEPSKQQKPCATVEPEQCREVVPNIQSRPATQNQNSTLNLETQQGNRDDHDKNSLENLVTPLVFNFESLNPEINEVLVETPFNIVGSSESCEGVKIEENTTEFFVVDQVYKDMKGEDQILEDQLVAEEVVIGSDITQDEGINYGYLIMESVPEGSSDPHDVINVIGIHRDPSTFSSDPVVIGLKEKPDNPEVASLGENHVREITLKKPSSVSPEGHQFLSSDSSGVTLGLRLHSNTLNDIMISKMFSDVNADDGSDDDSRFRNQGHYAKGGKMPAYKGWLEESKSGGVDEVDSLSPASCSDSQRSLLETSPEMNNPQSTLAETSFQFNDSEDKSISTPEKDEGFPQPCKTVENKPISIDSPKLREVSVNLSYMTDLDGYNDYLLSKDPSIPKGMCKPQDSMVHFKTVHHDCKFYFLQTQLYTLYNTTQHILDTDPVPCPPRAFNSLPTDGHCFCFYCNRNLNDLIFNYNQLYSMRSNRVCQAIDRMRVMSKWFDQINQTKLEDEELLNSIEKSCKQLQDDTLKKSKLQDDTLKKSEENQASKQNESVGMVSPRLDCFAQFHSLENPDGSDKLNEIKSEYSNLPPKKRKAFSRQSDLDSSIISQNEIPCEESELKVISKTKKSKIHCSSKQDNSRCCSEDNSDIQQVSPNSVDRSFVAEKEDPRKPAIKECRDRSFVAEKEDSMKPAIKECSVSLVKIKGIDGFYSVSTENSSKSDHTESKKGSIEDIPHHHSKSRHDKCRKHRKRSKEEKRLRKEKKRLKKLMKAKYQEIV